MLQAASCFRPGGRYSVGVLEHVQHATNEPPWAVDDPLGAHQARFRVRWDQRAVAALAVYYLVLLYLVPDGDRDVSGWCIAFVAAPLLIRNRPAFAVVAPAVGLLVLATLCAGWPIAPAGLPLLLAQIRPPARWMPLVVPVLFVGTTALLSLLVVWLQP